ncbi:MAG: DNA-binding protein [Lachnospiraceae bacterium]|nr:DNA-binding protein [Lachnospiraceae bacterium]MDY4971890.1 DNA-binding protein [Lachnospiraceae bacterium]
MDEILEQTLLYDFYGELLTEHQQKIYEDVVFNDLSYSEVAKEQGISRQGIYDMIKRINRILMGYEEKLHLVEQFLNAKKLAARIHALAENYLAERDMDDIYEIRRLSAEMMELQN